MSSKRKTFDKWLYIFVFQFYHSTYIFFYQNKCDTVYLLLFLPTPQSWID